MRSERIAPRLMAAMTVEMIAETAIHTAAVMTKAQASGEAPVDAGAEADAGAEVAMQTAGMAEARRSLQKPKERAKRARSKKTRRLIGFAIAATEISQEGAIVSNAKRPAQTAAVSVEKEIEVETHLAEKEDLVRRGAG